MLHRHFSQPPTELFRAKLQRLLGSVNDLWQLENVSGSVLEQDLKSAYHNSISLFLETLDKSILEASLNIHEGLPADPFDMNLFNSAIQVDLEVLFLEIAALDSLVTSSFNSIIAEREQVLHASRRIANKTGDYLLYADTNLGGGFFFGDSFNTLASIETASPLNDTEECFLSTDEGAIFLPLNGTPDRPKINSVIVNSNSNGNPGSNFIIDTPPGHDEILAITDNEPNTWYEYERVTAFESNTPLVLDLTFVLEAPSIVNHIHINPINFGTPTPVNILNIETSLDGVEYKSVKDDVPVLDFVPEDEENAFTLSPATSNFTGQGFYSFLPQRVQYVHITLEQRTPYAINTINGPRLRYGIGIRDINILGKKYQPNGSIISAPFTAPNEIKKLAMWASENPTEVSVLADITHSISTDDGATWIPIQPQGRSGTDISELLNFNNIAEDSINTSTPVTELRHRLTLDRFTDAFSGEATLKQEKLDKEELLQLSSTGTSEIILTEEPIEESINMVLPFWGSFGCPRPKADEEGLLSSGPPYDVRGASKASSLDHIEFNVDSPPTDTIRFALPYRGIEGLVHKIRVFVNGEQWEYSSKEFPGQYTSYTSVDEYSKIYYLNKDGKELQFGYTDEAEGLIGLIPPQGARIEICLDGDNPSLERTSEGYVLNLSLPSDGFKDNLKIISFDNFSESEAGDGTVVLSLEQQVIHPYEFFGPSSTAGHLVQNLFGDVSAVEALGFEFLSEGFMPLFVGQHEIEERDLVTKELISESRYNPVAETYIDGTQEFLDLYDESLIYYSVAPNGRVFFSEPAPTDREVTVTIKQLSASQIDNDKWRYYKNPVTGQTDTSRLVIDTQQVKPLKKQRLYSTTDKAIQLTDDYTSPGHSWFKQKLIKGTVKLPASLFPPEAKPTEVPFVDGRSELSSLVKVSEELMPGDTEATTETTDYILKGISDANLLVDGTVGFKPFRNISEATTSESQFQSYVETTPNDDGEWTYTKNPDGTVTVTIYTDGPLSEHYVSYEYNILDPGIDYRGQYSIDYSKGTLYLAETPTTDADPIIEFEVSLYSAFYNIAMPITDDLIESVIPEDKKVVLSQNFTRQLIKQGVVLDARPQYIKTIYQYYKKTTQSLQDLEPYFSPIAKDVAFKAITADVLEEL